jgi:hypothetical protein
LSHNASLHPEDNNTPPNAGTIHSFFWEGTLFILAKYVIRMIIVDCCGRDPLFEYSQW